MGDSKRIDFGVKALILRHDRFLVMHKTGVKDDLWELPGGRMEFGETAEQTIKREIMEETGLVVNPIKLLDTWDLIRGNYQITGVIYLCTLEDGEVELSHEHDGFKWIKANEESINIIYETFREKMKNWNWDEMNKILKNNI